MLKKAGEATFTNMMTRLVPLDMKAIKAIRNFYNSQSRRNNINDRQKREKAVGSPHFDKYRELINKKYNLTNTEWPSPRVMDLFGKAQNEQDIMALKKIREDLKEKYNLTDDKLNEFIASPHT